MYILIFCLNMLWDQTYISSSFNVRDLQTYISICLSHNILFLFFDKQTEM